MGTLFEQSGATAAAREAAQASMGAAEAAPGADVDAVASPAARGFLRLHLVADVGPIRTRALLDHFGSVEAVLGASVNQLQRVTGIGPRVAEAIFNARRDDSADRQIEAAAARGARVLCWADPDYPLLLRQTPDPPPCIFIRGSIEREDGVALAIVGSRKCTYYGLEQTQRFSEALARAGLTIVSGLARGIDSAAHQGALTAGGRTLAVLGNGLNHVYPPEHEPLADRITQYGALISELPMDAAPDAHHFPPRNRIIIGLSLGVLVVEASHRSGALISARLAADYNREAFALPGRVDQPQYTAGTLRLIREGAAQLVTSPQDVLDGLGDVGRILGPSTTPSSAQTVATSATAPAASGEAPAAGATSQPAASTPDAPTSTQTGASRSASTRTQSASTAGAARLSAESRVILDALLRGACDLDVLYNATNIEVPTLLAELTLLQLHGLVRALPGGRFELRTAQ